MNCVIRELRRSDDRNQFQSGNSVLNEWFRDYAGQMHFRKRACTVYVAEDAESQRIVGFVATAPKTIGGSAQSENEYRVLLVARLAVDASAERQGIAQQLVLHCFMKALSEAESHGYIGLLTDAKAGAERLYSRLGFRELTVRETTGRSREHVKVMFIPLDTVRMALSEH